MTGEPSFDEVDARLRAGDDEAAQEVFNRFATRLIRLAHRELNAKLRQKVDPEDVTQSVFRSFFTRYADGKFEVAGWESLWGLLVVITMRKCGRKAETFLAACRDVRREATPDIAASTADPWEAVTREPDPAEAAMLSEMLAQVMSDLTDREQSILALRLQGYTVPEISEEVGRSERTIHRLLSGVRHRLEQIQFDESTNRRIDKSGR